MIVYTKGTDGLLSGQERGSLDFVVRLLKQSHPAYPVFGNVCISFFDAERTALKGRAMCLRLQNLGRSKSE